METVTLEDLRRKMADFAKERDWDQFHSPRNLLLALKALPFNFLMKEEILIDLVCTKYVAPPCDGWCREQKRKKKNPFLSYKLETWNWGPGQIKQDIRKHRALVLLDPTILVGEVGELSEIFQWKGEVPRGLPGWEEEEKQHLGEELSDVLLYLVRLSDICGVDLGRAALRKVDLNAVKYPASRCKGSSQKHTHYGAAVSAAGDSTSEDGNNSSDQGGNHTDSNGF